jgi:HSP20 family molecular chaperone IbpA
MSDTNDMQKCEVTSQPERTRSGRAYVPVVDIVERNDELLLLADVPGASADGIDIDFERGQLTISARVEPRQNADTSYVLREYGVGDFVRTFQIGESVDASKIEAEVSGGVLTVHLPKAEAAKTRKIEVRSSGSN